MSENSVSSFNSSTHMRPQPMGWSSSPLGHSYRNFETEYRAKNIGSSGQGHGKRAMAQLASARVIWFIERCRQLELECKQLRDGSAEKDKKLKRHDKDVSELRKLINELCEKVRALKRTTKAAKEEAKALQMENVSTKQRALQATEDLNRRKRADDRLHSTLVKTSRELQDTKLDLENMTQNKVNLSHAIDELKKQSAIELDAQANDYQIRLDAANKRAEDALQELKDKTGGWDEMKIKVETSEEREQATIDAANGKIALMKNQMETGDQKAKEAALTAVEANSRSAKLQLKLDSYKAALEQKQVELEEQRRQAAHAQILFVDLEQQLKVANSKLVQQQWKKRQEGRKQRIQHVKSIDRKKSNLQARQSSGETSEFPFVEVNDDR